MLKKVSAVLFIAAIVCLGMVGALAAIPHVHGHDFDHSQHETCPVYQLSLHFVSADIGTAFVFAFIAFVLFFIERKSSFSFSKVFLHFFFLRAPPPLI